jgi:fatty-acid peroxygenase
VSFLALALRGRPDYRERLATDEAFVASFVQEVRRFYPFTPCLGARARHAFEWQGIQIEQGELAILDVYGTLRDARVWDKPDEFRPERFLAREPTAFDLIPNGGGDFASGHRCAGEWLTIETLRLAARLLTRRVSYDLAPQSFRYSLARIPTRPKSGIVLTRVRTWADPRCVLPTGGMEHDARAPVDAPLGEGARI